MPEEEVKTEKVKEEVDSDSDVGDEMADTGGLKEAESSVEKDTDMDESEGDKKQRACRQFEFYFSDSNLPYDRFMWTLHSSDSEHWVPIKTVASFKRMREFEPFGMDWLVESLKTSQELEVDESNTKIRRRTEVKEPKGQFERSIYAKGFGKEVHGLQQKLEKFFSKFGRVDAVRLRRDVDKGSVFVEFSDMSTVERFLKTEPKPTWEGQELLTMSKEAYCEMKIKEKGLTGKAAAFRRKLIVRTGFNAFALMKGESTDGNNVNNKEEEKGGKPKAEVYLEFMGKKLRVKDEGGGKVEENDVPYVKGSALKFTSDLGEDSILYEDIKNPLKERFGRPPFIKYQKGDGWGLVGFEKTLSEEDIAFVKGNVKTLKGHEVTWSTVEEADEKQFLIERAQNAARRALNATTRGRRGGSRGDGRGGRGRGRGDRRGGRSGGHNNNRRNSKPASKDNEKKTEASTETKAEGEVGEKRKRAVEPDGGPDVGIRGAGVPVIQTAKKTKKDEAAGS